MLVNIFINVLIVQTYLNQNKVIAVFFAAMVLLNVRQSSHDIPLVHSANTQKHTHLQAHKFLTLKPTCKRVCFSPTVVSLSQFDTSFRWHTKEGYAYNMGLAKYGWHL